jgi:DNA-binding IclR family transcriptional regulator
MSLKGSRMLRVAMPELRTLAQDTGLSVAIGTLWHGRVCYLFHGDPGGVQIEDALDSHALFPAAQSSIGRLLLASLPEAMAREAVAEQNPGRDYGTVDALMNDLPRLRAQGYALRDLDDRSLAVPIGEPPAYAGLAVAGDITDDAIADLLAQLRPAAKRIALALTKRD